MNKFYLYLLLSSLLLVGCRSSKKQITTKKQLNNKKVTQWIRSSSSFIDALKLNKIKRLKLQQIKLGMKRKEVRQLLRQVRYGSLTDYAWSQKKKHFAAYFIRKYQVFIATFDESQHLRKIHFATCHPKKVKPLNQLLPILPTKLTLAFLNKTPNFNAWKFRPVRLIKIVNALQKLGKEHALESLRLYDLAIQKNIACMHHYQLNPQKIFLLARLLFTPKTQKDTLPMKLGQTDLYLPENLKKVFPLFPIVLSEDIPFLLIQGFDQIQRIAEVDEMLKYAEKQMNLRNKPLSPKHSPFEAFENLIKSMRWKSLFSPKTQNISQRIGVDYNAQLSTTQRFWQKLTSKKNNKNSLKLLIKTVVKRKVKFPEFENFHKMLLKYQAIRATGLFDAKLKKGVSLLEMLQDQSLWKRYKKIVKRDKMRWNREKQRWSIDG